MPLKNLCFGASSNDLGPRMIRDRWKLVRLNRYIGPGRLRSVLAYPRPFGPRGHGE